MTCRLLGRMEWSGSTDEEAYRHYKIKWLVETDSFADGPARALACPGLPGVGSSWVFGNDNDPWARCHPTWTASQLSTSDRDNYHFVVEQDYSTKGFDVHNLGGTLDNPLLQPPSVSGTFVKFTRERLFDKDGKPIRSISFEPIRGHTVEYDDNRPSVSIEFNQAVLGLNIFSPMVDTVNDSGLWGLNKRCVKLGNVRWSRSIYGGGYYYTIGLEFEVNAKTFDKKVPQMGTKRLKTGGTVTNPKHWENRRDDGPGGPGKGDIIRTPMYYNSDGTEWNGSGDPASLTPMVYEESNFLILGIPTSF